MIKIFKYTQPSINLYKLKIKKLEKELVKNKNKIKLKNEIFIYNNVHL